MSKLTLQDTAFIIVFILFGLPFILKTFSWVASLSVDNSQTNRDKGIELIGESTIPWWIDVVTFLEKFGSIGAIAVIIFFYFLKWSKTADL